jgi:murein DD-endopeptidase MepM/ murein hydrolase activator NlpD
MLKQKKQKHLSTFNITVLSGIIIFIAILSFYTGKYSVKSQPKPIETITFEEPVKPLPKPEYLKVEKRIKRGDTIIEMLKTEGIDHAYAYRFFSEVKPVYDLRRISAGKKVTLFLNPDKSGIQRFIYEIDPDDYLEVIKDKVGKGFVSKLVAIPYTTKQDTISGVIEDSLFASILNVGEKPELADMMASLYEYDIDFNRDIRKKDTFSLVVEKMYLKGKFARYGQVLAAQFVNMGKAIQVIRYTDPEGHTAYYHPDGRSMRKMFLRCPLPFMRVTSRYGMRRHPVLKYSASHNGTDFAAPIGTKVRSTASGIVTAAGYHRGKGKWISIRHKNQYISLYYHLSRIEKGIRRGIRVTQGQLIGRVGKTGLATGPHLHYGLKKNNRFMNPLRLKSPTKSPVKKKYLVAFKEYTRSIMQRISLTLPQTLPIPRIEPFNKRISFPH